MEKTKVFSTLAAITVGAIAASGLMLRPTVAFADQHAAAGEHGDTHKGEKHCCGKDAKHAKGEKECCAKGEKSCSGKGEKSCSGK